MDAIIVTATTTPGFRFRPRRKTPSHSFSFSSGTADPHVFSKKMSSSSSASSSFSSAPSARSRLVQSNEDASNHAELDRFNNRRKRTVSPRRIGGGVKGPKRPLENPAFPPGNGMLVPELVPVSFAVFRARETLLHLVPKLIHSVPVKVCKYCEETHVGTVGHELATCLGPGSDLRCSRHAWIEGGVDDVILPLEVYHSFDRFKLIRHEGRLNVKRLPALVELCIQAGLDIPEYPTLRRTKPARELRARSTKMENVFSGFQREIDNLFVYDDKKILSVDHRDEPEPEFVTECKKQYAEWRAQGVSPFVHVAMASLSHEEMTQIAEMALRLWEMMRTGTELIVKKYAVRACGYCSEVHVGPRGHTVKLCQGFKNQWRDGLHGWQVGGVDDIIPPNYVWHVPNPVTDPCLKNEMRRYYGKAPALVELCVQSGAIAPSKYRAMMRMDVAIPSASEVDNAF